MKTEGVTIYNNREADAVVLHHGIPVLLKYASDMVDSFVQLYRHHTAEAVLNDYATRLLASVHKATNILWPVLLQPFVCLSGDKKQNFHIHRDECLTGLQCLLT